MCLHSEKTPEIAPAVLFQPAPLNDVEMLPSTAPSTTPPTLRTTRRKLWELSDKLHCPVIGTCLTLDDIKRVARKLGFKEQRFDEYELHLEAVTASFSRTEGGEIMQRRLEEKHAAAVRQFSQAKTEDEVLALWKEYLGRGDVAGGMWAALTHKTATKLCQHRVYGDVHMLSHQVGGGQAADIRRLNWLEDAQKEMRNTIQAQAAQITTLDAGMRQKTAEFHQIAESYQQTEQYLQSAHDRNQELLGKIVALESGSEVADLNLRLHNALAALESLKTEISCATLRAQGREERIAKLRSENTVLKAQLARAEEARDALASFWEVEPSEEARPADDCLGDCTQCDQRLSGRCVLCVGGRTSLLPLYKRMADKMGIHLAHHDGGREEHLSRLPELLNAADAIICPTDSCGHLAYYQLKRHAKQTGKPCVLTKNSGVSGFAVALQRLAAGRVEVGGQMPEVL